MKLKKFHRIKINFKKAHRNNLPFSTSHIIFIFGIFCICVICIRLIKNNVPNHITKDSLSQSVISPYAKYNLSDQEKAKISKEIFLLTGINAATELEGIKLNHVYGRMGKEQHLPKYPGDHNNLNLWFHGEGMTPGVGAFGYFAESKIMLTQDLSQMEKYYIAVQTLYLPQWNTQWNDLKPWFRFRKMLVINPQNGKMLVAVVGDAGPAQWTGKQFGGSPEVYHELQLKNKQDHVIVLFINDNPNNPTRLGPVYF